MVKSSSYRTLLGVTMRVSVAIALTLAASGCGATPTETTVPPATQDTAATDGTGELTLIANGEDFMYDGITSKEGWEIKFDHVEVILNDVTAYQSDPPYDPESDAALVEKEAVSLVTQPSPVTLTEATAEEMVKVTQKPDAPAGSYNALGWKLTNMGDQPAILLKGTASKGDETVAFELSFAHEVAYLCGEFVGDERKGMLTADGAAEVEMTFHWDHIFGRADQALDDQINTGALGFDPLAALAVEGQLVANLTDLESRLSAADYEILIQALDNLGHVGEGHCRREA
ncbi:hypothetical protein VB712_07890 [Spirulina sp. CCNP1310]|uniref:hypothetical protein n=1 Tax=Spirulina sp. CCNP1310 TaxID=3110249 RepID=UPI002B219940|nr:hypothetical protein [Spirulina sp. CCNP1310]MEA5419148.1 hypothetical protein [Spirulina sp. CCNP1310]